MPAIVWTETYATGIPDVDSDHQKIFDLVNNVYDAHQTGGGEAEVGAVIEQLLDYVNYHFEREESLLATVGYKDLEDHALAHGMLSDDMKAWAARFRADSSEFRMDEFIKFLVSWLQTHILIEDMAYLKAVSQLKARV